MRKIDSDGVERFDARLPVEVFTQAIAQGSHGSPLWARILGAGDYWLRDPSNAPGGAPPAGNVQLLGPIAPNATTPWEMRSPRTAYAYQATADGSMTAVGSSAGHAVWGHVGDAPSGWPFPQVEGRTSAGADTHTPLPIRAGQWYSFGHEAPDTMQLRVTLSRYADTP